MTNPNPYMLRWAREKAGLSQEEAATKLALRSRAGASILIENFENGVAVPTSKKLAEIAKLYRRPLITFFLESPPTEAPKGEDFRTLPNAPTPKENAAIDALLRDVYVRQNIVREALFDAEIAVKLNFVGSIKSKTTVHETVEKIKSLFDISLEEYRSTVDAHEAFGYLRKKIENSGIYVLLIGNLGSHHSNIPVDVFRGIAISDEYAPFIVVNDNDSKYAWSFTLLHELTHVFLGASGLSNNIADSNIEKFCNDVASYILLTDYEFNTLGISEDIEIDTIINIASDKSRQLNISASMITYRAYSLGLISLDQWLKTGEYFRNLWLESKKKQDKTAGGSYYATKKHKTGAALLNTVKRSILDGVMTQTKAGKVLGVKPGNVAEMVGL